jgi:hypothetical protein
MTKELNFNIDDIRAENADFYRWKEEMEKRDKTWFAYLLRGGNSTYVGLTTADLKYTIKFENMNFDEARRRLKFNHLRTNLDDGLTVFDKNILQDCRKLAENAWHKDCGLGYQVTSQVKGGRE